VGFAAVVDDFLNSAQAIVDRFVSDKNVDALSFLGLIGQHSHGVQDIGSFFGLVVSESPRCSRSRRGSGFRLIPLFMSSTAARRRFRSIGVLISGDASRFQYRDYL
jgi:hypothetical protein